MKRSDESFESFRTGLSTNSLSDASSASSAGLKRSREDNRSFGAARHILRSSHHSSLHIYNGAKRRSSDRIDSFSRSKSLSSVQKYDSTVLKNAEFNLMTSVPTARGPILPPISIERNPFLANLIAQQNQSFSAPLSTPSSSFILPNLLSTSSLLHHPASDHQNLRSNLTLSTLSEETHKKYEPHPGRNDLLENTLLDNLPDISNVTISSNLATLKPVDFVKNLAQEYGDRRYEPDSDLDQFFLQTTQEQLDAYQSNTITAIRKGDVDALRNIRNNGQSLQGCNKFGESIVHLSCRRSNLAVLSYLMSEGGVSLRVRDDYGRTPLHDAFWHKDPNIPLVESILNKEPKLLFISDKRGHTPLDYARKEHWETWNKYFETRIKMKDRFERTCG